MLDRVTMRVTIQPQRKVIDLEGPIRVGQLLEQLGYLPGTALVIRGDRLLTADQVVGSSDEIEIRSVISGGTA